MLDRFHNPEPDLSPEHPKFILMENYAAVVAKENQHRTEIVKIISKIIFDPRYRRGDPDFNFSTELEVNLQKELPEFNTALSGLRRAVDRVMGWHISWWQRGGREAIGEVGLGQVSETAVYGVVRAPHEYFECDGWLVGSNIGADPILHDISLRIEVADSAQADRGMSYQLGEMFMINLTPPQDLPNQKNNL